MAIDAVCLTVCQLSTELVMMDVIKRTLQRTIAAWYEVGDLVHVERSMTLDIEIGGHELSGHVDTRGGVERIERTEGDLCIFFASIRSRAGISSLRASSASAVRA